MDALEERKRKVFPGAVLCACLCVTAVAAVLGSSACVIDAALGPCPVPGLPAIYGYATYYTTAECHQRMANGKPLRDDELTAACWLFEFGTRLRVENLQTGKAVIVTVTDRGPARRFSDRVIDLSHVAFGTIAEYEQGKVQVKVTHEQ